VTVFSGTLERPLDIQEAVMVIRRSL
jgi:hypothetical protein